MDGFDPAFHAPARIQIGAVLASVDDVEFARLVDIVGVSDSVMSKHLSALVDAGYVKLRKAPVDGRQRTWALFTNAGAKAFAVHLAALRALAASAEAAAAE